MLSPSSSGLHCGDVDGNIYGDTFLMLPQSSSGLHRGSRIMSGGCSVLVVLPRSGSRPHFGQTLNQVLIGDDRTHPPSSGGLDCGIRFVIPPVTAVTRCSRRSAAGSIAARRR